MMDSSNYTEEELKKKKTTKLKELCRERGIQNLSNKRKRDLVALIIEHQEKQLQKRLMDKIEQLSSEDEKDDEKAVFLESDLTPKPAEIIENEPIMKPEPVQPPEQFISPYPTIPPYLVDVMKRRAKYIPIVNTKKTRKTLFLEKRKQKLVKFAKDGRRKKKRRFFAQPTKIKKKPQINQKGLNKSVKKRKPVLNSFTPSKEPVFKKRIQYIPFANKQNIKTKADLSAKFREEQFKHMTKFNNLIKNNDLPITKKKKNVKKTGSLYNPKLHYTNVLGVPARPTNRNKKPIQFVQNKQLLQFEQSSKAARAKSLNPDNARQLQIIKSKNRRDALIKYRAEKLAAIKQKKVNMVRNAKIAKTRNRIIAEVKISKRQRQIIKAIEKKKIQMTEDRERRVVKAIKQSLGKLTFTEDIDEAEAELDKKEKERKEVKESILKVYKREWITHPVLGVPVKVGGRQYRELVAQGVIVPDEEQ